MKIKFRMYLLLLAMGVATFGVKAQEESNSFTLEKAQLFAMENSYVLHNTKQDIVIAQKKVWETITIGLPQVTGAANYNMFLNLPVTLLPAEIIGGEPGTYVPLKFGQDFNADFGLTVSQIIFDGSYIVGVSSSQLYMNLSKQSHEKVEIDIREAVTQAYYMVLIGKRYKIVMEDNLANSQKLYEETKIYFENGFREEQDVAQVRIILKNAENEVLKANREISIAEVVLKYAMGFPLDSNLDLTDKLETFVNPLVAKESNLEFEFNSHIDYRLATSRFQLNEKLVKLEKAEYLPKISTFYNYAKTSYSNDANLFKTDWYPSSMIGFQATIPIFNSGQKRAKVQQAAIELDKVNTERKLTEVTLQKDYLVASAEMASAIEKFENDSENRELAQGILDKTKIKFNNGISGSAELSQIETQYINSFQALVASTMQLLQADLKLKKAAGSL